MAACWKCGSEFDVAATREEFNDAVSGEFNICYLDFEEQLRSTALAISYVSIHGVPGLGVS